MRLDPLQNTKDCVVPLSLDLLHPAFQQSEKIFSRPPYRGIGIVLAFGQRVKFGSILHLINIVFHALFVFRAFVISIHKRKSRPRPVIHACYKYGDLCLVYAIGQIGRLGNKRSQLEELQIACASEWFLVHLEALILDEFRALFARVEGKMKFQSKILKSSRLFK